MNRIGQQINTLTTVVTQVEGNLENIPTKSVAEKATQINFIRATAEDTRKLTQQTLGDIWGITASAVSARFKKADIDYLHTKRVYNLGGQANFDLLMRSSAEGNRLPIIREEMAAMGLSLTEGQIDGIVRAELHTEIKPSGEATGTHNMHMTHERLAGTTADGGYHARTGVAGILRTAAYNHSSAFMNMVTGLGEAEVENIYGPRGLNYLGLKTDQYMAAHWHEKFSNHDHSKVGTTIGSNPSVVKLTSKV